MNFEDDPNEHKDPPSSTPGGAVYAEEDEDDAVDNLIVALDQGVKSTHQEKPKEAPKVIDTRKPLLARPPAPLAPVFDTLRLLVVTAACIFTLLAMVVCLSGASEGWIEGLFMTQDKNYDTIAVTCGWYQCDVKLKDLYVRAPAFSILVLLVGLSEVVADLSFVVVTAWSLFTKKPLLTPKYFQYAFLVVGVAGVITWVLFTLPLMVYLNTRDMFVALGSALPLYLICMLLHVVLSAVPL